MPLKNTVLVQFDWIGPSTHKVESNAMLLCLWYECYSVTKSDNYDDLKCQTVKNYIRRSKEYWAKMSHCHASTD